MEEDSRDVIRDTGRVPIPIPKNPRLVFGLERHSRDAMETVRLPAPIPQNPRLVFGLEEHSRDATGIQ